MKDKESNFGPGDNLHLIDASGFIFRAYHALPALTRSDGTPVGAVQGFCNMLFKLLEDTSGEQSPTHLAVIFDHKGKTFRSEIYSNYKANRPPPPDDLVPQFSLVRKATASFNLPCIEVEGYEADDLIATYAVKARDLGGSVTIISSDKDLMQLVGNRISMFDSMKNKTINTPEVKEKFGVEPDKVADVQALAGDSTDNIPGASGIGVKTAAQLILQYGNLNNLLLRSHEIKQPKRRESLINNEELIKISKDLVSLKVDAPMPLALNSLKIKPIDINKILEFTHGMEFKSLSKRISLKLGTEEKQNSKELGLILESSSRKIESSNILNPPYTGYSSINSLDVLENWLGFIKEQRYFSIDTETTSLDEMKAELVGISMAISPGKACYIPLSHKNPEERNGGLFYRPVLLEHQLEIRPAIEALKPILEDPSILKIGQNIKYDIKIFSKYDVKLNSVDDTMLMSYALHGGLHRHGMDALSQRYLDHEPISIKSLLGVGKSSITFDLVNVESATEYAAEDADITLRLWKILKPKLSKSGATKVYETMERSLIPVLSDMELTGILIDREFLKKMSNILAQKILACEEVIFSLSQQKFNIGSPKQLGEILFEKLNLRGGKKSKNGTYSTNADVLENLSADGNELAENVLLWRQMAKLKSTYTDALPDHISKSTGRVHTAYNMSGTSTGRLSSSEPNLQNIPIRTDDGKKIREAFISAPGKKIVSLDYSQIELRILAHIANITSLKKAFSEKLDIHAMTASEMFNVPMNEMTPNVRRKAKAINFGVIYGISAFGLARNLRISREEAKNFIDTYFNRFPGIKDYMNQTVAIAKGQNYVETLFGRKIHTPNINSKGNNAGFAQRAAINAPIQGTAADIIKRAMIRVPRKLQDYALSAKMLLQVHDELIFEVPDEEVDKTVELVKKIMEHACEPTLKLNVPLVVDSGIGNNWAEAH